MKNSDFVANIFNSKTSNNLGSYGRDRKVRFLSQNPVCVTKTDYFISKISNNLGLYRRDLIWFCSESNEGLN